MLSRWKEPVTQVNLIRLGHFWKVGGQKGAGFHISGSTDRLDGEVADQLILRCPCDFHLEMPHFLGAGVGMNVWGGVTGIMC